MRKGVDGRIFYKNFARAIVSRSPWLREPIRKLNLCLGFIWRSQPRRIHSPTIWRVPRPLMLITLAQRSKLLKAQVRPKRTEVAQKLMALSEAYSRSTNEPSFSALWWLARLLNVLMVSAPHAQSGTLREPLLVRQGTVHSPQ